MGPDMLAHHHYTQRVNSYQVADMSLAIYTHFNIFWRRQEQLQFFWSVQAFLFEF